MQVMGHGGKKVDQTKGAENVAFAALPGAAFFRRVTYSQGPNAQNVFRGEKHHAPEFQLMKELFVIGVNFRNRVQNHRRTVHQNDNRDHPLHIPTEGLVRSPCQDLHHIFLKFSEHDWRCNV